MRRQMREPGNALAQSQQEIGNVFSRSKARARIVIAEAERNDASLPEIAVEIERL
jgi:hypothetical protein